MARQAIQLGQGRFKYADMRDGITLVHPGKLMNIELTSDDGGWDFAMYNEAGEKVAGGGNTFNVGSSMPAGTYTIYATYNGNEQQYQTSDVQWIVRSNNEQPDRYPPGGRQPPRRFGSNKTPGPVARALRWMTGRG